MALLASHAHSAGLHFHLLIREHFSYIEIRILDNGQFFMLGIYVHNFNYSGVPLSIVSLIENCTYIDKKKKKFLSFKRPLKKKKTIVLIFMQPIVSLFGVCHTFSLEKWENNEMIFLHYKDLDFL